MRWGGGRRNGELVEWIRDNEVLGGSWAGGVITGYGMVWHGLECIIHHYWRWARAGEALVEDVLWRQRAEDT